MVVVHKNMVLGKTYVPQEREAYWQDWWEKEGIYHYAPPEDMDGGKRKRIFSIDTPPPTVSGKMHIGHAYSYSQMDFIARYKRMRGYHVFYPFGTDDNGLATERLVERLKQVRGVSMPRDEFVKLCRETVDGLRPEFVRDWKRIGISADYQLFYSTINPDVIRISQKYFLDLVRKDRVYRKESPILYCPHCRTAIAQVELEDKEREGIMYTLTFTIRDGQVVPIGTTRPELLSSVVAVFIHPKHPRVKDLVGRKAVVPLFKQEVPIIADESVSLEKGTGIVMCATFGDQKDIEWYKQYGLPLRMSIGMDGRMTRLAGAYAGLTVEEARKKIIADLREAGLIEAEKPVRQVVNVHERCGTPIEILHGKQWFIRILDLKEDLRKAGESFAWHPAWMKNRYDNWVDGLKWDWCISRQRFFGVPFPVWYDTKTGEPIYAKEEQLPVDPLIDLPEGYTREEVEPERDVMDTWATSSLTPQIAIELFADGDFATYFPETLRPQAHDIISFWLFNTVVRGLIHQQQVPWEHVMISGWVLDPKGRKMSKSKGNVIHPQEVIKEYGADALRYAAAGSKLGEDVPFQWKDVQTGLRTVTKLYNAARFALMHLEKGRLEEGAVHPTDVWILHEAADAVRKYVEAMDAFSYSQARRIADDYFWHIFTEYYIEFVKHRLYDKNDPHARWTLREALFIALQVYAPFIPFITEEIYHAYPFRVEKSIHLTRLEEKPSWLNPTIAVYGRFLTQAISLLRKAKSEAGRSMRAPVRHARLVLPNLGGGYDKTIEEEIRAIMHVKSIIIEKGDDVRLDEITWDE